MKRIAALIGLFQIGLWIVGVPSVASAVEDFDEATVLTAKYPGMTSGDPVDYIFFPRPAFDPTKYDMYVVASNATDLTKAVPVAEGFFASFPTAADIPDEYKTWFGASIASFAGQKIMIVGVTKGFTAQTLIETFSNGELGDWTVSGGQLKGGEGHALISDQGVSLWRNLPDFSAAGRVVVTAKIGDLPGAEEGLVDGGKFQTSVDGGASWQTAMTFTTYGTFSIDITSQVKDAAKNSGLAAIRFIGGTEGWELGILSVEISATP